MRKSTAVPTVKHQILELRSATSIQGANFAINDRPCVRQRSRDLLSKVCERSERVPIAREQLSTAMFDCGECAKAVVFQLEDPRGIIEWQGPFQERHWLEIGMHGCENFS